MGKLGTRLGHCAYGRIASPGKKGSERNAKVLSRDDFENEMMQFSPVGIYSGAKIDLRNDYDLLERIKITIGKDGSLESALNVSNPRQGN